MPARPYYTAEMVRAIPNDGNRYETVHGELLVTPAPGGLHQPVLAELFAILDSYLRTNGVRHQLLWSPADIAYGPATLVQPDLFVAETAEFIRSGNWEDIGGLHLVIEVISKSSIKTDRTIKRRLYQEQNIPVYWILDVDLQHVEIWAPDASFPIVERSRLIWQHPALSERCEIDLRKLFTFPSDYSA